MTAWLLMLQVEFLQFFSSTLSVFFALKTKAFVWLYFSSWLGVRAIRTISSKGNSQKLLIFSSNSKSFTPWVDAVSSHPTVPQVCDWFLSYSLIKELFHKTDINILALKTILFHWFSWLPCVFNYFLRCIRYNTDLIELKIMFSPSRTHMRIRTQRRTWAPSTIHWGVWGHAVCYEMVKRPPKTGSVGKKIGGKKNTQKHRNINNFLCP